jgi:O-acetyl-ADP-ribose deacetylase (regulator of RNase III)
MPVIETTGDVFAGPEPALAHGCNCAGAMGRGIALEFRTRWPDMYEEYRRLCMLGTFNPGDIFVWTASDRLIFTLGTQRSWRTKASPQAIAESTAKMVEYSNRHGIRAIGMPRIAAGLGGLDWGQVRTMLDEVVPHDLLVTVYSPPAN